MSIRRPSRIRRAVAVVTFGAMVGGLLLPPAHVHLDADHDGHDHAGAVVHQHWGGHEHEASGTEIEHGGHDGRVFVLDQQAIASSTGGADQGFAVSVPIFFLTARLHRDRPIRRIDTGAPPHGPPRRSASPRAPPRLSI